MPCRAARLMRLELAQELSMKCAWQGAVENLAQSRFANQAGAFPPQLADMGNPSMHMPPMPWGS